jgi:hypothetical protein
MSLELTTPEAALAHAPSEPFRNLLQALHKVLDGDCVDIEDVTAVLDA